NAVRAPAAGQRRESHDHRERASDHDDLPGRLLERPAPISPGGGRGPHCSAAPCLPPQPRVERGRPMVSTRNSGRDDRQNARNAAPRAARTAWLMYEIEWSAQAVDDLNQLRAFHRPPIAAAVTELAHQAEAETRHRKRLRPG